MPAQKFVTRELPLAAYLQVHGFKPAVVSPDGPAGLCTFEFDGDSAELARHAQEFAGGGTVPALEFADALNALKTQIRYARGGWR